MRDKPQRPSQEQIDEWLRYPVDPMPHGIMCKTYVYTDLENDDIPSTFTQEDYEALAITMKLPRPHPC